jgi:F-type H+-transporting ATPase subunit b
MMTPRRAAAVLLAVPFLLSMFAEEGGGARGGSGMAGKIINFVILAGGLFFLLRKPVKAMLAKRTEGIRAALDEARTARAAAEAQFAEARHRLASLEEEVARLTDIARTVGLADKDRILAQAEKEVERIRTLAVQEVDSRLQAGLRELKAYTAALAAEIAEARLKGRLNDADQSALIDRSIDRLRTIHERPHPR